MIWLQQGAIACVCCRFRCVWDASRRGESFTKSRENFSSYFLLVNKHTASPVLFLMEFCILTVLKSRLIQWELGLTDGSFSGFRPGAVVPAGVWAPCSRGDSELLERIQRETALRRHTATGTDTDTHTAAGGQDPAENGNLFMVHQTSYPV